MEHGVQRGSRRLGGRRGDRVRPLLERPTVVRHEPEAAGQFADLDHAGRGQAPRRRGTRVGRHSSIVPWPRSPAGGEPGYGHRVLVWMDLEMTGLAHTTDVIVEIATVITNDQLETIAEGPDLVVHQPDDAL